jgi:hypothetical protein
MREPRCETSYPPPSQGGFRGGIPMHPSRLSLLNRTARGQRCGPLPTLRRAKFALARQRGARYRECGVSSQRSGRTESHSERSEESGSTFGGTRFFALLRMTADVIEPNSGSELDADRHRHVDRIIGLRQRAGCLVDRVDDDAIRILRRGEEILTARIDVEVARRLPADGMLAK